MSYPKDRTLPQEPEEVTEGRVSIMKCPHCGREYSQRACKPLIPTHDYPPMCRQVCPGSGQTPRNAETDNRPLWKDEKPSEAGSNPSAGAAQLGGQSQSSVAGEPRKRSALYEACPRCNGNGCLPHAPGEKAKHCFGCKSIYVVETGVTAGQLEYIAELDIKRQESGISAAMLRDGRAREMVDALTAIQTAMHAEFAGKESGDVVADFGVFLEHHKDKEAALLALYRWQATINDLMPDDVSALVDKAIPQAIKDGILGIDALQVSGNDIADQIEAEKPDWRIGLSVKPKFRQQTDGG